MEVDQIKNRVKIAIENILTYDSISGRDLKSIVEFQHRDIVQITGEDLTQKEAGILIAYSMAYN